MADHIKLPPWFNTGAPVGYGMREPSDFPTCRNLIGHMDRLGVSRSLVWNLQARDHHPGTGNRRLLQELSSLGTDRERLLPSLVIAPAMIYENGALDELHRQCSALHIRALRSFPGTIGGHRLRMLEPVLRTVADCAPVLFVDLRDCPNYHAEISDLAELFPQMPIICERGMWGHMMTVFDLMRRHANVYISTAWIHTHHTLRHLTGQFGTERVIFAMDWKAHNGASIAGLLYSGLPETDIDAIAHRNLETLLDTPPTPLRSNPARPDSLWGRLLSKQLQGLNAIDGHGHLGLWGTWLNDWPDYETQIQEAVELMDMLGISRTLVSGTDALVADSLEGNRLLAEKARKHAGRFSGYVAFHPLYADKLVPQLDVLFANPFFVGFKMLCGYWRVPLTDKRFVPMLEYAQLHRLPVLCHTWEGACDSPALLGDIVKKYPDVTFILGHSGGTDVGREQAVELARAAPNVYLEWCGSFCSQKSWEEIIPQLGAHRVLFGTDGILHDMAWELGRLLSLDLPDEQLIPILGDNMRKILSMRV